MRESQLALIAEGRSWTFAALRAEARRVAQRLAAFGVRPGDRVGMLLPNAPHAVFLIHAAQQLGAVLVPLNLRLTSAELLAQAQRVRLRCLVHNTATAPQASALAEIAPLLDIDAETPSAPFCAQKRTLEALHTLMFTSGTTGQPKAAMLTWGNHFWSAIASGWRLGVHPEDRWLLNLPLYHVGGLAIALRAALYGIPIVLHSRFDPEMVLWALARDRVTILSLVPTMLKRLLDFNRDRPLPEHVRVVLVGGAATPAPLLARALEARVPVALTYGLTEAASQVATATPDQVRAQRNNGVGYPLRGVHVRIADADGAPLPPEALGEVWVRGPIVMRGYWDDPEATARTLTLDGWLRTGDLGYCDARGQLWVVQRRTDLIISGGENIYPAEVEAVLLQHPEVEAACVVGVEDAEWGQRVVALVQRVPGAAVRAEALQAFCRKRLAGYKCPRAVLFVDALPLTASGKVDRKAAQAWATQAIAEREAMQS